MDGCWPSYDNQSILGNSSDNIFHQLGIDPKAVNKVTGNVFIAIQDKVNEDSTVIDRNHLLIS